MDNIKKLFNLSHDLSTYTMSMRMATKYKCDNNFNLNYYNIVLQNARKEIEDLQDKFMIVNKETGEIINEH